MISNCTTQTTKRCLQLVSHTTNATIQIMGKNLLLEQLAQNNEREAFYRENVLDFIPGRIIQDDPDESLPDTTW